MSDKAINFIKEAEGAVLHAYPDPKTHKEPWTIGYGNTSYEDGSPIGKNDTITQERAEQLLSYILQGKYLPKLSTIPYWSEMTGSQQATIISFAWNLGPNFYGAKNFETITAILQNKLWEQIPAALYMYRNPGNNIEPVLRSRRVAEGFMWYGAKIKIYNQWKYNPIPVANKNDTPFQGTWTSSTFDQFNNMICDIEDYRTLPDWMLDTTYYNNTKANWKIYTIMKNLGVPPPAPSISPNLLLPIKGTNTDGDTYATRVEWYVQLAANDKEKIQLSYSTDTWKGKQTIFNIPGGGCLIDKDRPWGYFLDSTPNLNYDPNVYVPTFERPLPFNSSLRTTDKPDGVHMSGKIINTFHDTEIPTRIDIPGHVFKDLYYRVSSNKEFYENRKFDIHFQETFGVGFKFKFRDDCVLEINPDNKEILTDRGNREHIGTIIFRYITINVSRWNRIQATIEYNDTILHPPREIDPPR